MEGPALAELGRIAAATQAKVIASGGVGTLADLEALARETPANVEGAIVGRALYERRFTVAEAKVALASP
jgi:phosphoribosylformimino-5-aminoimidazole carboxamide ribonucleotide (ProFAR) isomerase